VPAPGPGTSTLNAVSGSASNDVWAVGDLILHWDGTQWSGVPNPVVNATLSGVVSLSPGNAWSVGWVTEPDQTHRALVEHWDGSTWSALPPNSTNSALYGIAASQPLAIWAVGRVTYQSPYGADTQTLVEGYADPFLDVPPDNPFYSYVHCMACRGIISGYDDGTYRPANNVTRGQLSKIISNSAGFSDPQTTQMFEDVPVGTTFFDFIGRLASRGYISGYPCGGRGEPCGPGNLPYFRPNNNSTRGQISKIDANAAGYSDPPSGEQFEDVAVGSAFYTYTYRLVSRGVMSGYPCGAHGEPCIPPDYRPYFRPNYNATRGQTAKIVGNTFFPDCQTPARK